MDELSQIALKLMNKQHFDCLAVGVIDFKNLSFKSFEIQNQKISSDPQLYFDLASLTKFLTVSTAYLIDSNLFDKEMMLLLNHSAGFPAYGRLSKDNWHHQLNSYKIKKSIELYSDFSALRLMLEIEKKTKLEISEIVSKYWDDQLLYWQDLPAKNLSPQTGFRRNKVIQGEVLDDNAYLLKNVKCTHAGLFATVNGLCKTIINMQRDLNLMEVIDKAFKQKKEGSRFVLGFDTVTNPEFGLAGIGASSNTFGHLGFTGTSVWINPQKNIGSVILTNATKNYWYDRVNLNNLRRELGKKIWHMGDGKN